LLWRVVLALCSDYGWYHAERGKLQRTSTVVLRVEVFFLRLDAVLYTATLGGALRLLPTDSY
jgi:EamA domain-containing membrane protein RarD